MEDEKIVELFLKRDETAVSETEKKYGHYCYAIASNILFNQEDAEECVNDTLLGAWISIPPHRPELLSTFLAKITRQLSIKKLRTMNAQKRGGGKQNLAMDELEECIPSGMSIDEQLEAEELAKVVNAFLGTLKTTERSVFLRRYWYFESVGEIAARFRYSESKVKSMLKRTRDKLRIRLLEEDIWI